MSCSIVDWVEGEFKQADFGDSRLVDRYKKILIGMMKKAQKNICSTFDTWSEIKACYRFIKNEKTNVQNILFCHQQQTLDRIAKQKQVLLIQDTTYFDFNSRKKTSGLDCIIRQSTSKDPIFGLILHNTMALSTDGIPLGLFSQDYVERKQFHDEKPKQRYYKTNVEDKESYRWIKTIKNYHNSSDDSHNVIHVADREGDIYELYREASLLKENFIIRSNVNRSINKIKRREPPKCKLFNFVEAKKANGKIILNVQINGKTKFRKANLSIIYTKVTIPPPPNKTVKIDGKYLPNVNVWAVMAVERNPSKLHDPIKWLILTNLPINCIDDAVEKIKWYSYRWNIEIFHKILKSGCAVEKAQLNDADSLKKYITIKSIIAWRIFWLTRTLHETQDISCEAVLTTNEWKILYRKMHKKSPPSIPPSVKEIYYWIANLGGYLHRKSDAPPGIISIWRGWTRFMEVIEDYHAFCG